MLSVRALIMRCAPIPGARIPYQAECGVFSQFILTRSYHSLHHINESWLHTFVFNRPAQESGHQFDMHMTKKVYFTPESEEIEMIVNNAILEGSNTEGIGGGTDD